MRVVEMEKSVRDWQKEQKTLSKPFILQTEEKFNIK